MVSKRELFSNNFNWNVSYNHRCATIHGEKLFSIFDGSRPPFSLYQYYLLYGYIYIYLLGTTKLKIVWTKITTFFKRRVSIIV